MGAPLATQRMAITTESLDAAADLLRQGEVVAFPTETVYGLGADAFNETAVRKIFTAKGRPQDNPLIVHVCSREMADLVARTVTPNAVALMEAFWPGPLSIILRKDSRIPDAVSAGLDTVAIRMPASEAARAMIARAGTPVAAPSANVSGRPSPTNADHVWNDMQGRIPLILDGGSCDIGVESTVIDMTAEIPRILRPGDITLAQVRAVAGDAQLHEGIVSVGQTPASPGMKYRHYAPSARVFLLEGSLGEVAKTIRRRYDGDKENGLRPLILCADASLPLYEGLHVRSMGCGPRQSAQALFYELRRADEHQMDTIYFHFQDDMGLAVRNRIAKAAAWEPQEDKYRR